MKIILGGKRKRSKGFRYLGEVIFIAVGTAIMLFPLFAPMGHIVPTIGAVMLGFFLALMGAVVLIDGIRRENKRKKVIAEGKKYTAVVTHIHSTTRRQTRRGRNVVWVYCAECEMTDPETNEKYLYNSLYTTKRLDGSEGKQVTVYVDPADRSNYFVDISNLT